MLSEFCDNRQGRRYEPSDSKKYVDALGDKGLIYAEPTPVFAKADKKWTENFPLAQK